MEYKVTIKNSTGSCFDVEIRMSTYQHAKYVSKAIEGVLMQKTNYKYCLIISDDGSNDGTQDIILEYQKKYPDRITTVLCDTNTRCKFRQFLIPSICKARYVTYCEGDDYWTNPYKLQKQINFLDKHPEYIAVTGNVRNVNADGSKQHRDYELYAFRQSHIFTEANVLQREQVSHLSAICHRNIMLDWDDNLWSKYYACKANGDLKISSVLAMNGDIYYSHEVFGDHVRSFEGASWTASINKMNEREKKGLFFSMAESFADYIKDVFGKTVDISDLSQTYDNSDKYKNNEASYEALLGQKNIVRLYDMWVMANKNCNSIANILKEKGIKTIAIYGFASLGVRLFYELKESSIKVVYGRDRNNAIKLPGLDIFQEKPENIEVDAIVVTALSHYDEIREKLLEEEYSTILALDDLLYQIVPEDPELCL